MNGLQGLEIGEVVMILVILVAAYYIYTYRTRWQNVCTTCAGWPNALTKAQGATWQECSASGYGSCPKKSGVSIATS